MLCTAYGIRRTASGIRRKSYPQVIHTLWISARASPSVLSVRGGYVRGGNLRTTRGICLSPQEWWASHNAHP